MRVLILGNDGYIGYALTLHLLKLGHEVWGLDDGSRRKMVRSIGSDSLTPILGYEERNSFLKRHFSNYKNSRVITLGRCDPNDLFRMFNDIEPEAIYHLAEQPSAPWSMIDPYTARSTQSKNVLGTLDILWVMKEVCPEAHLIKIGSMGEYGTPGCDIPEGEIPKIPCVWIPKDEVSKDGVYKRCPMSGLPFPRSPGSFYHLSKVHDTHNIIFACHNWGLRSTDIMQGVVFGLTETDDLELTRFDYDEYFGTVINRFCTQAIINHPLTVYGIGQQTRGFLPLKDSIQCLTIALDNPPELGEYRVFNQFENIYSVMELAVMVCKAAESLGFVPTVKSIKNPRNEEEVHYYRPIHDKLFNLGYSPSVEIYYDIIDLIKTLSRYSDRVNHALILPTTTWR